MLVVQQNCGKRYECTISALEAGLGLEASIVCIQEPFLGNRSISHSRFNFYWPSGTDDRRDMRVLIAVRKDILNTVIIENRTDLVSHPYCIVLDVKELDPISGRYSRKTRVVNLYDNKIGNGCIWQGTSFILRRAIPDISWRLVIKGRVLIIGDMNAHSPVWNPYCRQNVNAGPLEELIESFELILNNNTDFPTRSSSRGISIIDLALTSPALGPLRIWEIPEDYSSLSDHELILIEWEDIDTQGQEKSQAAISGWSIKNLLRDEKLLKAAEDDWKRLNGDRQPLNPHCTKLEFDKEAGWFQEKLTELLNNHAKITKITSYSKRWWNKEVSEARLTWARDKRRLGRSEDLREEFKQAQYQYFRTIKKAKRVCWQKFLQGEFKFSDPAMDKNYCWKALKYTKPLQFRTTPVLKDSNGNTAVSMRAKEALVRRSAFPKPPTNLIESLVTALGFAHTKISEELVGQALIIQVATKAPRPDKINFQILQMIWGWDKARITSMVYHSIRLGYHPTQWKRARGILLEKGGKRDCGLVRSYRVISLLNCIGKVVKKVVAKELSQYCEDYSKLHLGQMGKRKERSAIDVVAALVHTVQEK